MTPLRFVIAIAALTLAAGASAKDLSADEVVALSKAGTILSKEKLDAAALAKHPGGKIEDGAEVEKHRRGYVYEVEVIDASGNEWDMDIDAANGRVLKNEQD